MSSVNWIGSTGSQSWSVAGNWDTGAVPVTGDDVYINFGNSDINGGLNQSAVALNSLNVGPGFSGTIGTTGNSSDSLQIGYTTGFFNCLSGRIKIDYGSSTHITYIIQMGNSLDSGLEAFRFRGGSVSSKLYVAGSNTTTVGGATTRGGLTATLSEWDIEGGVLNLSSGVTAATGKQSGGTVTMYGGATTITQTGNNAILVTEGAGVITTLSVTNQAYINSRPAAGTDVIGTLNVGPGALCDFSGNPSACTLTNAPLLAKGAKLKAFLPNQVALHSASLQVKMQQCGLSDVSIDIGAQVLATLTNW